MTNCVRYARGLSRVNITHFTPRENRGVLMDCVSTVQQCAGDGVYGSPVEAKTDHILLTVLLNGLYTGR